MDLTPLVHDESLNIVDFVDGLAKRFRDEVVTKLQRRLGQ